MVIFSSPKPHGWILGDKFNVRSKHHDSIKALWETKWKFPCGKGVYPFHDGDIEDFAPVFDHLIKNNISDAYSDAYTRAFLPQCASLTVTAEAAAASSHPALASYLYLRIAALYRIARFPIMNSTLKFQAWEAQKAAYEKAAQGWIDPLVDHKIPHTAASGADGPVIPVYTRIPSTATPQNRVPAIILITGLDGYRPDNTQRTNEFIKRGWATIVVEIPGTADCPAEAKDPMSPDRLWDSVFAWLSRKEVFDMGNLVAWGLSTGAYYAVRVAHTHKDKLRGSVAQGAGVHRFFEKAWLDAVDAHEYPFDITPALAQKFGYGTVEEFTEDAQKRFSLFEQGIVRKPSTRLLLINGTHDGLMPIEDSMLLLEHGSPKEARFFPELLHMGYPFSNDSVYPWLEQVMAR